MLHKEKVDIACDSNLALFANVNNVTFVNLTFVKNAVYKNAKKFVYKRKMITFVKNTAMKDKILFLMQNEGLTPSRFAEILEIQPSTVSHLLSGRNQPRYDMLQKILRRFPKINPDWLLLDSDTPFRDEIDTPGTQESRDDLLAIPPTADSQFSTQNSPIINFPESSKRPLYVVIFYDDGSCERFSMAGSASK